ncbi:MAG: hypothetical protein GYB66_04670 [Chloroflexi bacterium]|nr:hypothetical protein [Chloroflexota bacterium]
MTYRLELRESVQEGVARILNEQIDKALQSLNQTEDSPEDAIHDARKRFKKIRRCCDWSAMKSVMMSPNVKHLLSGCWAPTCNPTREHSCHRDSWRSPGHFAEELADGAFQETRQTLVARHQVRRKRLLATYAVEDVATTIAEARSRVDSLPITGDGSDVYRDGLERV